MSSPGLSLLTNPGNQNVWLLFLILLKNMPNKKLPKFIIYFHVSLENKLLKDSIKCPFDIYNHLK